MDQLVRHIQAALAANVPNDQITSELIGAGWKHEDIAEGFRLVAKISEPIAPLPQNQAFISVSSTDDTIQLPESISSKRFRGRSWWAVLIFVLVVALFSTWIIYRVGLGSFGEYLNGSSEGRASSSPSISLSNKDVSGPSLARNDVLGAWTVSTQVLPNAVGGSVSSSLAVSPDSQWVVYSAYTGVVDNGALFLQVYNTNTNRLYSIPVQSDNLERLLFPSDGAWTADSRYFFFQIPNIEDYKYQVKYTNFGGYTYDVLDLTGSEPTIVLSDKFAPAHAKSVFFMDPSAFYHTDDASVIQVIKGIDPSIVDDRSSPNEEEYKKQGIERRLLFFKDTSTRLVYNVKSHITKAWVASSSYYKGKIMEFDLLNGTSRVLVENKPRPFTTQAYVAELMLSPNERFLIYKVNYSVGVGSDTYLFDFLNPKLGSQLLFSNDNQLWSIEAWDKSNPTVLYGFNQKEQLVKFILTQNEQGNEPFQNASASEQGGTSDVSTKGGAASAVGKFASLYVTPNQSVYKAGQQVTFEVKPNSGQVLPNGVLFVHLGGSELVESSPYTYTVSIPQGSAGTFTMGAFTASKKITATVDDVDTLKVEIIVQ